MRGDGLPDNKAVIDRLVLARDKIHGGLPGKPAIPIPTESLHCYTDDSGSLRCVVDMEQVIYLAEEMLRRSSS